ncbi:aspartyl protease family protein [Pedobacter sp. ISL-68]|uniref:aspartyl protease family protein n=1 Tax=unclassified Pedobacter TaxID=2628915 RepID=UPI001BE8B898|nr:MULTISPECIES: aspartyl protease family protein [unclassified Pedobacter]MBT2564440.1 aspartyl protease family protein [Pedobacter sp. ISL-64]MBT2589910.1 aspartyl protease family protein [Pedobacter sp. ISL-68]
MKSISIPLKLINLQDDGFHLLVEVIVFKEKHFAVLDTGASRSVFDKSLIEQHLSETLQVSDEINAATLFTTTTTIQATIPELKIGPLKVKNYETVAFDLQSVSETYQQFGHPPIMSIIGGDILMEYKAVIDYKKMILRLYR